MQFQSVGLRFLEYGYTLNGLVIHSSQSGMTISIPGSQALAVYRVMVLAVLVGAGCRQHADKPASNSGDSTSLSIHYATGFTVRVDGSTKWLQVKTPYPGATQSVTYLLLPHGEPLPPIDSDVKVIRVPVRSIVCTSTSHLPLLDYIGESNKLIGFPQTDYISSEKIRARVDSGKVTDVGVVNSMNIEELAVLKPELVMGYTVTSDYGQFRSIEQMKIPVVLNTEFLERHPLGRAEWIKFMALFFNREREADSVFSAIEHRYMETRRLVSSISSRPTVLSGIVYGDTWFLPGGQNYGSRLLADAGCRYLWDDDPSNGVLQLSFESVYEKAHEADLWIGVGSNETLTDLANADHRYKKFDAFRNKHVYSYDALKGAKGGSVYLELGYLRPDIILQDLVKIAHPAVLPDHKLYFHRRLE